MPSPKNPGTGREIQHPESERPDIPRGYQVRRDRDGQLPWTWAVERLTSAHNYWIATTRPDGRPHVMPVWGIWIDNEVVFATDSRSRKAHNLLQNPRVAVHLESGEEAVILEGTARIVDGAATLDKLREAYQAKYQTDIKEAPGSSIVFAIRPEVGFGWRERDFPQSATRWSFR